MIEPDTLIMGNCLEEMKDIPDNSIDMVLCDLPYGVLNKNNENAKWDSVLPLNYLWYQYHRICKPSAAIILFGQGMFTTDVMQSNREEWKYNLIWDKCRSTGFLNAKRQPLRTHEDIMVFCAGSTVYHPQMMKVPKHLRNLDCGKVEHQTNRCYGSFGKADYVITDEKYPHSIIEVASEHKTGKFFHPTQKPVDLCRYLIRTYSDEGMTVLDNTMGSGTTCVAAVMEKRHYIGIEKDPKYFIVTEKDPDNHDDRLCDLCCFEHWCRHAEKFGRQRPCMDYNLSIKENEYFEILGFERWRGDIYTPYQINGIKK